jgi:hypothetical protein
MAQGIALAVLETSRSLLPIMDCGRGLVQPVWKGKSSMKRMHIFFVIPLLSLVAALPHAAAQVPGLLHASRYTRAGTVELEGDVAFSFFRGACFILDVGEGEEEPRIRKGGQDVVRFRLAPGFGFFVTRGLQIGLKPLFSYSQYSYEGPEGLEPPDSKEYGGGAEVFLRYVISTRSAAFPFIGFSLSGGGGKVEGGLGEHDYNFIDAGPQLGIKVLMAKRGILTFSFNYWFESYESGAWKGRETRHFISFSAGLGLWL